ncbi:MAG: ATP-dependent Clp protease ATP-binding subunit [Lawsonibacter sp.]|nr:ATP-dependent Clp protease ATP-binding subunit [Lawsonibacter sp.]
MEFTQFCTCGPAGYNYLKRRVDQYALQGRSCEFAACQMPPGCQPSQSNLGFWQAKGRYLLYSSPPVTYQGPNPRLSALFDGEGQRWFPCFQALTACLEALEEPPAIDLFHRLREELEAQVLGQEQAVEAAAFKLYGHILKKSPARPLSLIFYGPTCVGKSELGKALAPALNRCCGEERYRLVWTELNTFTEAHSAYRLIGAPPGYMGYDDPPVLEAVGQNPYTVFMFDELDKAHGEVLKIFMSILDEGRCAARREDSSGSRELNFRHCIFLFTTNTDLSTGKVRLGFAPPPPEPGLSLPPSALGTASLARHIYQADEAARQALTRSGVLKEIAGRFSGLIGFRPLDQEARVAVTAKQIAALGREYGLQLTADPAIARALTPEDALSLRSTVGVLEGLLTPFLLAQCSRLPAGSRLRLSGTPDAMRLLPA